MALAAVDTCDVNSFLKCSQPVKRIESCKLSCAPVVLNTNEALL
jgi:hypothetical protein